MAETHTVETAASTSTGQVRAHGFPALEEGNTSFPHGRYFVDFQRRLDGSTGRCAYAVAHRVAGALLLERLIEKQKNLSFVCTVSAPLSSYRATEVSEYASQQVAWDEDDLGEPPLLTPMIVVSEPFELRLRTERDGVHTLWDGRNVKFRKGMRLAVGTVVQLRSSVFPLLSFREDTTLSGGTFQVMEETEEDFRFLVNLAPDLHRFVRYRVGNPDREHVLTHVVSACLSRLKSDWSGESDDEGWQCYRSLQALAEQLHEQGQAHWADEQFSPELVATTLYPHKVLDAEQSEPDE